MRLAALGLTFALVAAACGNGPDSASPSPTEGGVGSPSSSTSIAWPTGSSASVSTTTDEPPPENEGGDTTCTSGGPRSGEAAGEPLGDVDGDGQADQVYLSGGQLGVETSTGVVSEVPTGSARPVKVIGVADANEDGRGEIFVVSSGVSNSELVPLVNIAVFAECRLVFVTNVSGDPYSFEFGDSGTGGRGVGCVDVDGDGRRELVGLAFERSSPIVSWKRTVVRLDGTTAVNGPTDTGRFVSPQDDDQIALLGDVTCGENALDAELGA